MVPPPPVGGGGTSTGGDGTSGGGTDGGLGGSTTPPPSTSPSPVGDGSGEMSPVPIVAVQASALPQSKSRFLLPGLLIAGLLCVGAGPLLQVNGTPRAARDSAWGWLNRWWLRRPSG